MEDVARSKAEAEAAVLEWAVDARDVLMPHRLFPFNVRPGSGDLAQVPAFAMFVSPIDSRVGPC